MQNFIGRQISHYHILEQIGLGGMAVVFHAFDRQHERDVAIKFIRIDEIPASQHERLMTRFEREARAQALLSHPNIVPAYDFGEADGIPYLVLGYMSGGTLKERIHGGINIIDALDIIAKISDAIAYAHQMGILHRDIKPTNIIFSSDGVPMLTDFGIAKVLETTEVTLTTTGIGLGTPEYMAPEQWQGQSLEASDQYALGVVLYELLTGQKPYTAETPLAVGLKVINDPLPQPSEFNREIPVRVEHLLYKILARNPEDRFENMDALHQRLVQMIKELKPGEFQAAVEKIHQDTSNTKPEKIIVEAVSEQPTHDALDMRALGKPASEQTVLANAHGPRVKKSLPQWIIWAAASCLLFILVWLGINLFGGFSDQEMTPDKTDSVFELVPTETLTPSQTAKSFPTVTPTTKPTSTLTPTITPTLGIGSLKINPNDGAEMVYVPEGEFTMGSNQDVIYHANAAPEHIVYLDAYWIYKTEVTNAQLVQFLNEYGNQDSEGRPLISTAEIEMSYLQENLDRLYFDIETIAKDSDVKFRIINKDGVWEVQPGAENYPVSGISWFGADAYCRSVGGRLPTEAEWEKAARGTDGRNYPWGNDEPNETLANFGGQNAGVIEVGSYEDGASPYGVLDMTGNANEWVSDYYSPTYYYYTPYANPKGPENPLNTDYNITGTGIARGGSFFSSKDNLFIWFRGATISRDSIHGNGFRCVFDVVP